MTRRLTARPLTAVLVAATLTAFLPLGGASPIDDVNDLLQDVFGSGAPQIGDPGIRVDPCNVTNGGGTVNLAPLPSLHEYGDAPDGTRRGSMASGYIGGGSANGYFPTLSATANSVFGSPGARHLTRDVAWLGDQNLYAPGFSGPRVAADAPGSGERDADTLPDEDGLTPNLDGPLADEDRRDGGLAPATFTAGGWGTFEVRVTARDAITDWYVNALVDWNFDGKWRGGTTPEWSVVNLPVSVPADSTRSFTTIPFPVGTTAGQPWVRLTLTPAPIPTWTKGFGFTPWDGSMPPGFTDVTGRRAFTCGETEDHCGLISVRATAGPDGGDPPPEFIRCSCYDVVNPEPPPPVKEQCDPNRLDFYAGVRRVYAGTIPATYMTSPHTGTAGWGLRASDVAAFGITAEILYCDIEYGLAEIKKMASPAGTAPNGWRETGNGFAMCTSGVHVDNYPYGSSSGHALDRGDYEIGVQYWWGCPSLGPGAGNGVTFTRVIVH